MAGRALRHAAARAAVELLSVSQSARVIRRFSRARGIILALHRVLPESVADFSPNATLQIKPDFLEYTIGRLRQLGFDLVDIDEALRRIESDEAEKPFAAFTFDDAYRDTAKYALPVLRRQQCPFTLYIPTALVDGVGEVWWQALEDLVATRPALAMSHGGETDYFACGTLNEKLASYHRLHSRLSAMPESDRVRAIRELAAQYDFDLHRHCRALIMDWSELKQFAQDQLCTLGAHGVHHYQLGKLAAEDARNEMAQSLQVIRAQFGKSPMHFAYPGAGDAAAGPREFAMARQLGLRSAVTSRDGAIYSEHRSTPHSLPRVVLNGLLQSRRYVDVLATPPLFALTRISSDRVSTSSG